MARTSASASSTRSEHRLSASLGASIALGAALLSAGLFSGCGARVTNGIAPLVSHADVGASGHELPDTSRDVRALATRSPSDAREAFLVSFALEQLAENELATRALLADVPGWEDPLLSVGRLARIQALRASGTAAPEIFEGSALARFLDAYDPEGRHPIERSLVATLMNERAHDLRVAEHREVPLAWRPEASPASWRVAGPLQHFTLESFEAEHPAERAASLNDLELPDGVVARTQRSLDLGRAWVTDGSGVSFAETFVHVPDGFDGVIVAELPLFAELSVNAQVVLRRGADDFWGSAHVARQISLPPGTHRLLVKFNSGTGSSLRLHLVSDSAEAGGDLVARFDSRPQPWSQDTKVRLGPGSSQTVSALLPSIEGAASLDALEVLVVGELGALLGDATYVGDAYAALGAYAHPFATEVALRLSAVRTDLPQSERQEAAAQLVSETDDAWLELPRQRMHRASVYQLIGREDESLAMYRDAAAEAPASAETRFAYGQALTEQGMRELAFPEFERAAALAPNSCAYSEAFVGARIGRYETLAPTALDAASLRCAGVLRTLVQHGLAPRQEHDEALRLLRLFTSWGGHRLSDYQAWIDYARSAGRQTESEQARGAAVAHGIDPEVLALPDVDDALREGAPSEAAEILSWMLASEPSAVNIRRAMQAIDGAPLVEDMRADGLDAVRRYLDSDVRYNGAVVFVLDRLHRRYFSDRSSLGVVHQVIEVKVREALSEFGEMGIPPGATLLSARVIGRDGGTWIPEHIPGKDSISMPRLEVGDFVELEWVEATPPMIAPGSAAVERAFYFKSLDGPLHESTAIYDLPVEHDAVLELDLRNFEGEQTRARVGDFVRHEFRVTEARPPVPEPSAPGADEWMPSVRWVAGRTWEELLGPMESAVQLNSRGNDWLRALAETIVADAPNDVERARRVFRYVNDEVAATHGLFQRNAVWTLRTGEGDRYMALWALLEAIGMKPELVWANSVAADITVVPYPSVESYNGLFVRVSLRDQELMLDPILDHSPFDYVPPSFRGQSARVGTGENAGETFVTRSESRAEERMFTRFDIVIDELGDAQVDAREQVPVGIAGNVRTYIESLESRSRLVRGIEAQLSQRFPNATVTELEIGGLEEYDEPLVFRYSLDVPGYARMGDGEIVLERRFVNTELAQVFGSMSRRSLPLVVGEGREGTLEFHVRVPEGFVLDADFDDVEHRFEGSVFQRIVTRGDEPHTLSWRRELGLPAQRVAPDAYAAFASFLRSVDAEAVYTLRFIRQP